MFSKMKKVYGLLEDDLSKDIFLNRVLYNITGKGIYIQNITATYFDRMKREFCEYTEEVKKLREKIRHRRVVLYGIGHCGFVTLALFSSEMKDIELAAFCDQKADKVTKFCGYAVIDIKELAKSYQDAVVLVTPVDKKVKDEIIANLLMEGVQREQIIEKVTFDDAALRKQYFDEVMVLEEDEVFVDAGCCNCATDIDFRKRCPEYKEIIAFEPDPVQYANCMKIVQEQNIRDIQIYNMGLWDKEEELSFQMDESRGRVCEEGNVKIQVNTLDHIVQGKRVSFIKMDIEGAELRALKGCEYSIVQHRPKLAISIYHKPEDIVEILYYIHEIVPNYKFYIRHHAYGASETVLYAIPK